MREETLQLAIQLRRQGLVVREDERWPPVSPDDVGDRHRLPRPSDAEERLKAIPALESGGELADCVRLVPRWGERGLELEGSHGDGNIAYRDMFG
jgi:hypothetical protein